MIDKNLNYNNQKCKNMENINNSPTAVAAQEGPSVSVVGDTYRIVIGSEETRGAYALMIC